MRYTTIWRNKFLTTDATSIQEMADTLSAASEELRKMQADGVQLDKDGIRDDYAFLWTTDPEIAKKYGLELDDDDNDIG